MVYRRHRLPWCVLAGLASIGLVAGGCGSESDSPEGQAGAGNESPEFVGDGSGGGSGDGGGGEAGPAGGGSDPTGGASGSPAMPSSDIPPPNDLDPGDGTPKEGATVVYNGKTAHTSAGNSGCHDGQKDNQYFVQFGVVVTAKDVTYVYVGLPKDRLPAVGQDAVFEVGPEVDDWAGHDQATVLVLADGVERGAEGQVWVTLRDDRIELRFQDIELRDDKKTALNGNTVSAAYLCPDTFE